MAKRAGKPEGGGYEKLRKQKSLEEILATAVSFERRAFEFYSSLRDRVSKPLRELVDELAAEEQRHWELFESLLQRDDVRAVIQQRIDTPVSDHRFSDYIQTDTLGEHPDDQSVLQYALGREQAAMEQYSELAGTAPPGPIRELFEYLAREELAHKGELEKRYYELVYPTQPDKAKLQETSD